jgi:hypothetical protein
VSPEAVAEAVTGATRHQTVNWAIFQNFLLNTFAYLDRMYSFINAARFNVFAVGHGLDQKLSADPQAYNGIAMK